MGKLKKYNQRILAIIGSLTVLLLFGLFITGIVAIVNELTKPSYVYIDNAITIEDPTEDSLRYRDQYVTFLSPILIDTLDESYLIPVSQIRLSSPEYSYEDSELLEAYSYSKYNYRKQIVSYRRNGNFNNFIIRNQKTDKEIVLFNQKSFITSFQYFKVDAVVYVVFEVSNFDSNKDRKLNSEDLSSLYCYDLSNHKMDEIKFENMGLLDFQFAVNSDEIHLEFGLDKNKNGEINTSEEPSIIKVFNFKSKKVSDLIDESTIRKVQRILD